LVLDWAIELEKAGITGTEFSFMAREKLKAQDGAVGIHIGTIGTFAGNMGAGNVAGPVTVSDIDINQVREFVEQVQQHANELESAGIPKETFEGSLMRLQDEIAKDDPDRGAVRGLLSDVRTAMSGAAGNLFAAGIGAVASKLLG
jgi:hypothetical protein